MKRILFLTFFFALVYGGVINAQQQDRPKDKKKIELRPNSREYRPVRIDNFGKRHEFKRDKALLLKKRMEMQRMKMMQMKKKKTFKQEQLIRKRQMMQQRRALRR